MALLPNSTQAIISASLEANVTTPRLQAYLWMQNDPMISNYSDARLLQRFALATFYYATNGEGWNSRRGSEQDVYSGRGPGGGQCKRDGSTQQDVYHPPHGGGVGPPGGEGPRPPPPGGALIEGLSPPPRPPSANATPPRFFDWLSYFTHECNWFSKAPFPEAVCNEEREYRELTLLRNGLSGSIPLELALLTSLQVLRLGENCLTGTIPPTLWQVSSLVMLELNQNTLTGSLQPDHLEAMHRHMISLDVGVNQLQGTLPSELGLLSACARLFLNDNGFSGTIPSDLAQMTQMQFFSLGATEISGSIPPDLLSSWRNLKVLLIGGNNLSGSIPQEVCSIDVLEFDCAVSLCGCHCECNSTSRE
eukprot:Sro160_g072180.2  (363) ;mRNA; r:52023-53111